MAAIFWIKGDPHPPLAPVPLAVVLCPRGGAWLGDEMLALKTGGIEDLVSLLEEDEADMLNLSEEGRLAEENGMRFLSHPIPDVSVPPDTAAFRAFVSGLASRLSAGEHLGVHCRGSIGRATVTAACTLIHLGWPAHTALAAIEAARGLAVPDTQEQEDWILRYQAKP
jgi:protein-tyrosine phosphatase